MIFFCYYDHLSVWEKCFAIDFGPTFRFSCIHISDNHNFCYNLGSFFCNLLIWENNISTMVNLIGQLWDNNHLKFDWSVTKFVNIISGCILISSWYKYTKRLVSTINVNCRNQVLSAITFSNCIIGLNKFS